MDWVTHGLDWMFIINGLLGWISMVYWVKYFQSMDRWVGLKKVNQTAKEANIGLPASISAI